MSIASRQQLVDLCRDVLAPLLAADGGELYLVSAQDEVLAIHLGGTCAGCPGSPITVASVIRPAVQKLSPTARVVVSMGARVPPGAVRVQLSSSASAALAQRQSQPCAETEVDDLASAEIQLK